MPKKVPPKPASLGKKQKKETGDVGPSIPVPVALSLEERTKLKAIFDDPIFKKGFHNARLMKPSITPPGLATQLGGQIALIQLSRIQGWEMFEAALAMQVMDKIPKPAALTENYNDPDLQPTQ